MSPWGEDTQPFSLISFYLLYDYCFPVLAHGICAISLAPKFTDSVCKLYIPPFLKDLQCAFSFQIPHKSRNVYFGRDALQLMNVLRTYFSLCHLHSLPFDIVASISRWFPCVFLGKTLPSYLSAQTWCAACNTTLYLLNSSCLCPLFHR